MTLKGRLQKVEEALDANKKFFLWLDHAKAAGGFVTYWERELKGPLVSFKWFGDEEAYFLWRLVNDVNIAIWNDAQSNRALRSFAHCALDGLLRQIARPDPSGVLVPAGSITEVPERVSRYFLHKFKTLIEETLLLAAAVDDLSQTYLNGGDVLFADSRCELLDQISQLRVTAHLYEPLAAWLNVEPVEVAGFPPGHARVGIKAAEIANFSRAAALAVSGSGRQFKHALQQFCPELMVS
jgi:hypothetical protein